MKAISALSVAMFSLATFAATSTPEGWLDDYDAALKKAAAENKHVVADFSGSDWCGWCKRLDKEVFATEVFRKAAAEKYVLLMVDSPMDKALLTPKAAEENPKLVEKYRVAGFPTVIVLDAKGEEVTRLGYAEGGPEKYVEKLDAEIRDAPDVKKYIKPIEDVLNRYDKQMEEESKAAMEKARATLPQPDKNASKSEQRKFFRKAMKAVQIALFDTVYSKYVPLYDRAFAEAKAMKVPEHMEARKQKLVGEQEARFEMLKSALKAFEEEKKSGKLDADEGEEEDDEDDEEEPVRRGPVFVSPKPEDAHTDAEFFEKVAVPFWRKHIVDSFHAPEGMDEKTAASIVKVREALVRKLATAREEFPTSAEFAEADKLWNKAKCRDAAVGLLRYLGMASEPQYWQGGKMFKEMIAKHDDGAEPMLGYLLRWGHAKWVYKRLDMNKREKSESYKSIFDERATAFDKIAQLFKEADCRILEKLDTLGCPDPKAGEKVGNRYLALIQDGGETNLLEAVKIKPDGAVAMMALAKYYGFRCGGNGAMWFNRAVSNSLDGAVWNLSNVLQGQTTRWGGSTEYLYSVASNAVANVRTDSTFSYRVAAAALKNIYRWEVEHVPTDTNICDYVIGPELRNSLFKMFDAYIAAGEQPLMPSVDTFRSMAMSLAMQLDDWEKVRHYASQIKASVFDWHDALWLRFAAPNGEYVTQINMFLALADSRTREDVLRLGESMSKGDMQSVFKISEKMLNTPRLREEASVIASRSYYRARKALQEAAGGWVDAMPTPKGNEAVNWWGMTGTAKDGRARLRNDKRGDYRIQTPLPGLGYEYEATIHFEDKDPKQKYWNIGWGWSHPYVGFCMDSNSWAFPYIRFWRDESGDHYHVESYTRKNLAIPDSVKFEDKSEEGWSPKFVVSKGDLEKKDSHSFRLAAGKDRMTITVDGNEVFSASMDEIMGIDLYQERVRPDGTIYPVWKVFKNTAFSGYRYRRIPAAGSSDK